ncbi:hypothetical protein V6N13_102411 [Hibiscus sabdariffa]|uniref:Uncharacterized protein n=1 Tax=Hibiscus sabdariffa TaxID=183260 RepID=A0ABR2D4D4_9ROSI
MGGSSLSFKALFGTLMLLGLIFVGTVLLQSEGNKTARIVNDDESWSQEEQADGQGKGKGKSTLVHQRMDLNYMSKRRVPNGPDPIHNRRAGNSRRHA